MSPSNNQKVKKKKGSQRRKDPKKEIHQKVVAPYDFCPRKEVNEMDYSLFIPIDLVEFFTFDPHQFCKSF